MNSVIRMSHGMVLVLTFVIANSLSPYVHGQTLNKTEQERADVVKVLQILLRSASELFARIMQLEQRAIL